MSKSTVRMLLCSATAILILPGCMIPVYRLPQGFSSSYHRQLYGMDPVVIGGVPEDQIAPYNEPGVFFPTTVHINRKSSESAIVSQAPEHPQPVMLPPSQTTKPSSPNRR